VIDEFLEVSDLLIAIGWALTKLLFVGVSVFTLSLVLYALIKSVIVESRRKGGKHGERKV